MDQLKAKDEEYVKAIKKQNDDIDELIKNMKKQFNDMRDDYTNKLNEIEEEFRRERNEILNNNEKEIKMLFKEQRDTENHYMIKRATMEEQYTNQLEQLRTSDANEQTEHKIRLEKEMQIIQKVMEDMKAVYRLNEEKLDFN